MRRLSALAATMAVASAFLVATTPANASTLGILFGKSSGTVYSQAQYFHRNIAPGGAPGTYQFKIVNTNVTAEQFKIVLTPGSQSYISASMYKGYKKVANTYFTPAVAAGSSLVMKVKITVAAGAPPIGESYSAFEVRDPDTNEFLDLGYAIANVANSTAEEESHMFLKSGSQPFAAGAIYGRSITSSATKAGKTVSFTLRLQNYGASPAAISLLGHGHTCHEHFSVTVKNGLQNVTSAVNAGTYTTPTLPVGGKQDLTVQVKLNSAPAVCGNEFANWAGFTASGPDGVAHASAHTPVGK